MSAEIEIPPVPALRLKKPLALVGLMGVGKTTVGKRLADVLHLPFVDADEEIEKSAGMPITEIFARFGEPGFRDGEQKVISRLIQGPPCILATGGGAMTNAITRENLKAHATTLWLKTDLRVLARRVAGKGHRPLLKDRDPLEVLKEQARLRYPFYEQADIVVDTGDQTHAKSIEAVMSALKTYLETQS